MPAGQDHRQPITVAMVEEAKENLILRRETHLDQLADKLREERVRRVVEPIVRGLDLAQDVSPDDVEYVVDLGLVRRTGDGLQIATRRSSGRRNFPARGDARGAARRRLGDVRTRGALRCIPIAHKKSRPRPQEHHVL
jgi:hypothetical protein